MGLLVCERRLHAMNVIEDTGCTISPKKWVLLNNTSQGMVVHTYNSSTWEVEARDQEFKAKLCYTAN